MDHAIELPEERLALGKPETGRITISAKNTGGEIFITISDDGSGLDTDKLLKKARSSGLLTKPESEYTEKEIFNLILLPGFSTNTAVTEFSGRGVGMDVVRKNIEQVGGTISIASEKGKGTTFTIKIPLTLAIVDGMHIGLIADRVSEVLTVPQENIIAPPKNSASYIDSVSDLDGKTVLNLDCEAFFRDDLDQNLS